MGDINLVPVGLASLGLILNIVGWCFMARNWKGESFATEAVLILFMFPAAWILSAIRYRQLRTAFWLQTTGVFMAAGAGLLNLAVQ